MGKRTLIFLSSFFLLSVFLEAVDVIKPLNPNKGLSSEREVPKLTLSAQTAIRKPADQLQMKIGVVTLSDRAENALVDNSGRMQSVIRSLESAGLSRSEYETGQFAIHPTYTPYPKNPPPEWKPSINGYEVSNSIVVRTNRIEDAGKLIDAANRAGANSIDNIRFILRDPHMYWGEAISAATANAMADAKIVADAAGVKLVRLLGITIESMDGGNPRENSVFMARATGPLPPLEPGDINITAQVSIIYEISP